MNSENNSTHSNVSDETHKTLEFVVLEEGENADAASQKEFHPKRIPQVPFTIRILCFVIATIAFLWFIGAFIAFITASLFGALFLYRNETLNGLMKKYWRSVRRGAAVATSLIIAVFSPQLGFVVLLSYFIMQDEAWQKGAFGSILRSQFGDYM